MEPKDAIEKIVPSLLSGLGGAAAWGWKTFSSLTARIRSIEEGVAELRRVVKQLQERDEGRQRVEQAARRMQGRLAERVVSLEGRMTAGEADITANHEALIQYTQEQNEQWNDVTRSLGYLEGKLQATPPSKLRKTLCAPSRPSFGCRRRPVPPLRRRSFSSSSTPLALLRGSGRVPPHLRVGLPCMMPWPRSPRRVERPSVS
jgi:hypothetical protein